MTGVMMEHISYHETTLTPCTCDLAGAAALPASWQRLVATYQIAHVPGLQKLCSQTHFRLETRGRVLR